MSPLTQYAITDLGADSLVSPLNGASPRNQVAFETQPTHLMCKPLTIPGTGDKQKRLLPEVTDPLASNSTLRVKHPKKVIALRTGDKPMIAKTGAFSSFSVNDLNQARSFYSQTLGLQTAETAEGLELEIADGTKVFVYPKPNHVPATFTVLNFKVKSIEDTVDELKQRGVRFERYNDAAIKTDPRGIFWDGDMAIAWFKDPAGNILSALQSSKR